MPMMATALASIDWGLQVQIGMLVATVLATAVACWSAYKANRRARNASEAADRANASWDKIAAAQQRMADVQASTSIEVTQEPDVRVDPGPPGVWCIGMSRGILCNTGATTVTLGPIFVRNITLDGQNSDFRRGAGRYTKDAVGTTGGRKKESVGPGEERWFQFGFSIVGDFSGELGLELVIPYHGPDNQPKEEPIPITCQVRGPE